MDDIKPYPRVWFYCQQQNGWRLGRCQWHWRCRCARWYPDELTTFLTPDTKALVAEVERLRAERDAGGAVRRGWLEEEIAATDALLSDERRNEAS